MQHNNFFSLEQIIERQPLTVAPETPLTEVIRQMQEWANSCYLTESDDASDTGSTKRINNSCALVIEDAQLQGIFTERDLVRLIATERDLAEIAVGEVMSRELCTLTATGSEDVFTALNILRQQQIRHLPIIDESDRLLGLITEKNLRQNLKPIDLMKWREVEEVMSARVIHALPTISLRHTAQLMANHLVSCIAIVESDKERDGLLIPVGIITERDIVQFQTLNLDLAQSVQRLMSTPLFLVNPEDSLWTVHQQMQQRRVRRLLVAGSQGELQGIITQTSLLQVFDPTEMYGVVEILQRQVSQLEIERAEYLQNRTTELEEQVRERTSEITKTNQQLQQEINQRQQIEAELRQAHQQLFFHINNSPLAVVEWNNDFRVKHWSTRTEDMFGWQESEVLGKHWRDWQFVYSEDIFDVMEINDRLLNGTEPRNISHNRNYTKDGSVIDCEWYNSILLDESGNLTSFFSLVQDVSERQAALRDRASAESKLRMQARQQEAIAELGQYALAQNNLVLLMERAVNLVTDLLDVEYCKLLELQPDGNTLLLKAGVGWHDGLVGVTTVRADTNSQAGYTLLSSEPVVVTDLLSETRFSGSNLLLDHQVVSGMSVIILDRDRPFGVLGVHTAQHRVFSQDDLNFVQAIANIIAQANERQLAEATLRTSEQRFDSILSSLEDVVWSVDPHTFDRLYLNSAAAKIYGRQVAEFYDNPHLWLEVVHPEDYDRVLDFARNIIEMETGEIEYRIVRPNGEIRWLYERDRLIRDADGTPIRLDGIATDISARQRREEILKDIASGMSVEIGENFLLSLVEYLSKTLKVDYAFVGELIQPEADSIKTLAVYGKGKTIDNFEYHLAGTPCQNIVGQELYVYPETVQQLFPDDRLLQEMAAESYAGMPIFDSAGRAFGLISIIDSKALDDISLIEEVLKIFATRATAELERQDAENKIRKQAALLDLTHDTVLVRDLNNIITFWNRGAEEMYGWRSSEALGKNSHQLLRAKFDQLLEEIETELFRQGHWSGELIHQRKDGTAVTVMGRWSLLKDAAGNAEQILEINHDISKRKQGEAKIREQAALLDVATDAIIVRGLNNQILFWNRGAEKLYGWTQAEALERDANELLYRESLTRLPEIQQAVISQGEWQGELKQVTKASKDIVVQSRWTLVKDDRGNPQSSLVVNTDITEQKELEAQFLRTQRLESLGTLASGIAHDLNNILAPILGFSRLLPLKLPDLDEQTKGFFQIMENNANRGTALVKQILTFARGIEGDRGIVQVRHLITEIKQIIEKTFPKVIELEISAPKNLWTVNGDVNQLHQVLMNLAVNARDAMPDGGKLKIAAENFPIGANFARLYLDAHEGSYILITVSDNGVGIPPEIIERIFEPFFTTKEIGRGTGLGLSTVIGIVKSHGGFVDVVSDRRRDSRGTQFKVFLPASGTAATATEETEELPQGNGELILVVDDEPAILEVTKATLETYNYRVLTASDGIEAIALYAQQPQEISVVLMDLMMPEMSGLIAMRTLRKINPSVKLIANSGLVERDKITAAERIGLEAFLAKPYTAEQLLQQLKDVITVE